MSESSGARSSRSLSERINQAFETLHPADRGPYTNSEVADWSANADGPGDSSISVNYIAALRSGQRNNPTLRHLRALARFFDVPISYFIEDDEQSQSMFEDLRLLAAMRDADVRQIAARAIDLDPAMRSWLRNTVSELPAAPDGGVSARSGRRRKRFQAGTPDHGDPAD